ncbi:hypothetical protein BKA62DRAFT_48502 [Auriculariales sp. MPI-PUGE-AT-0066]|nr:hypothetical protein BKA62DRAFT_48502 [Auriculariales sp. MPI-PUGE-AT-0066]
METGLHTCNSFCQAAHPQPSHDTQEAQVLVRLSQSVDAAQTELSHSSHRLETTKRTCEQLKQVIADAEAFRLLVNGSLGTLSAASDNSQQMDRGLSATGSDDLPLHKRNTAANDILQHIQAAWVAADEAVKAAIRHGQRAANLAAEHQHLVAKSEMELGVVTTKHEQHFHQMVQRRGIAAIGMIDPRREPMLPTSTVGTLGSHDTSVPPLRRTFDLPEPLSIPMDMDTDIDYQIRSPSGRNDRRSYPTRNPLNHIPETCAIEANKTYLSLRSKWAFNGNEDAKFVEIAARHHAAGSPNPDYSGLGSLNPSNVINLAVSLDHAAFFAERLIVDDIEDVPWTVHAGVLTMAARITRYLPEALRSASAEVILAAYREFRIPPRFWKRYPNVALGTAIAFYRVDLYDKEDQQLLDGLKAAAPRELVLDAYKARGDETGRPTEYFENKTPLAAWPVATPCPACDPKDKIGGYIPRVCYATVLAGQHACAACVLQRKLPCCPKGQQETAEGYATTTTFQQLNQLPLHSASALTTTRAIHIHINLFHLFAPILYGRKHRTTIGDVLQGVIWPPVLLRYCFYAMMLRNQPTRVCSSAQVRSESHISRPSMRGLLAQDTFLLQLQRHDLLRCWWSTSVELNLRRLAAYNFIWPTLPSLCDSTKSSSPSSYLSTGHYLGLVSPAIAYPGINPLSLALLPAVHPLSLL